MQKLWLVARYEYLKAVRRRSFVLATLGVPLLIVAMVGVVSVLAMRTGVEGPVGYVDQSGVLASVPAPPVDQDVAAVQLWLHAVARQADDDPAHVIRACGFEVSHADLFDAALELVVERLGDVKHLTRPGRATGDLLDAPAWEMRILDSGDREADHQLAALRVALEIARAAAGHG